MPLDPLHTHGRWFTDTHGRAVILRGVNLGGDQKCPVPNGYTHLPTDFADHRTVTFVGRPFPLHEAAEHLGRLRHWGFNVLRLLTSWEACEHAGPRLYDTAYLDYYAEVCRLAGDHGLYVIVDFHQDVWSRPTGGDGAPVWLLEKVGIDYTKLSQANAALCMAHAWDHADPRERQPERYPVMCWSQNYRYAGNAIMWTLFFAGRDFAPGSTIDGQNAQDYLQEHLLGCARQIALRVKDMPHVIGFDALNEPNKGWVGTALSDRGLVDRPTHPALPGIAWSPLDALAAASGHSLDLPYLDLVRWKLKVCEVRRERVNPEGVSIWLAGRADPFAGAWTTDAQGRPRAVREDYFQSVDGQPYDFNRQALCPFLGRAAATVQEVRSDWLLFGEKDATESFFDPHFAPNVPSNFVNATHWYDIPTLGTKHFYFPITLNAITKRPVFGRRGIRRMWTEQMGKIAAASAQLGPGGCPTLIGEFGIPYDLDHGKAYDAWANGDRGPGPWKDHVLALELMYDALDANLLGSAQWCYSLSNKNDGRIGDGWNQEDLSVFSRDQQVDPSDPDSGGRAVDGFCRPYARRFQGVPISVQFERRLGALTVRLRADPAIDAPTELYLPRRVYPNGFDIEISAPGMRRETADVQVVHLWAERRGEATIRVTRASR